MKNLIIAAIFMHTCVAQAQEKSSYINPGLLSSSLTLSPAKMLNRNEMNYYLSGYLEGRVDKHLSVRGETHYMLGNADTKFLKNNIRTFFGLEYGIPIGNLDLHAGFMPGMSVMQSNFGRKNSWEVVPSISFSAGMKFYIWKIFNVFAHVNYVRSSMNNLTSMSGKADELVFSGGLGYNFQVLKKYR